jgi:hypothetical protein
MSGDVPKFSLLKFKTLIRDTRGPSHAVNEVLHTQEELDEYLASCQDKPKPKHPVAFPDERAVAVAWAQVARRIPRRDHRRRRDRRVRRRAASRAVRRAGPVRAATDGHVSAPRIRCALSGIVSFRQVPDSLGYCYTRSRRTRARKAPGERFLAVARNPPPTTLAVGEETPHPTTLAAGEETQLPTTLATGERPRK